MKVYREPTSIDARLTNHEAQFLIKHGLREYPSIEELIRIASSGSDSIRHVAFEQLCGPFYETMLEKDFDPSRFSPHAFIPGVRNGGRCHMSHEEVRR